MSSEASVAEKSKETVHSFGDSDLSDVILVSGDHEFHCHKMMLAARSEYFKALFFSDFNEKNMNRIKIDVDPVAMKNLLEIVYTGYSKDIHKLMDCLSAKGLSITNSDLNKRLWNSVNAVFTLADRFFLSDIVRRPMEYIFIEAHGKCDGVIVKGTCNHCATKLITATHHKMSKYKEISVSTLGAIEVVLSRFNDVRLDFSASDILFLMKRPVHKQN